MEGQTLTICEACREEVDQANPNVVRGVEIVGVGTFGEPDAEIEGLGAYFHAEHFPPSGYKKAPKPKI